MADQLGIDLIFHADQDNPLAERSFPWEEICDRIIAVIKPAHWARDMHAFQLVSRDYRYHAD